jgi:hypothetical protein
MAHVNECYFQLEYTFGYTHDVKSGLFLEFQYNSMAKEAGQCLYGINHPVFEAVFLFAAYRRDGTKHVSPSY